jgi:SagB-type dehydrogenase family enzyme
MADRRRDDPSARARAYHERTKHHLQHFARSPGHLDWATQPDPFRTYRGAPRVELPLTANGLATRYDELFVPGAVEPHPPGLASLGALFELALGLTAWKELQGSRWALRADPSSGNLHPTEGYVVLGAAHGVAAGVHHYVSHDHVLERRSSLGGEAAQELERLLPGGSFLVGLSSIHWREAWKYGERAFRYCQHDAGHVIGTVRYAAAALGWSAALVEGPGDAFVAALLGLDRDADFDAVDRLDREHPGPLLLVDPRGGPPDVAGVEANASALAALVAGGEWAGSANPLSPAHREWSVIDDVAAATRKPATSSGAARAVAPALPDPARAETTPAAAIIRGRRSAVALDGTTSIAAERFHAMLDALLPRPGVPPWDALPWEPRVHLVLFVHRVRGLEPGLYLLERSAEACAALREVLGSDALWTTPAGTPEHLRLSCLARRDCRRAAALVSCHQEIAADGAFSLGMIVPFRETVDAAAHDYRRLFWETGVLGQVLYLEAEAAGVRATGIGCFFDDAVHEVVGLTGDRFQSLYHFTVGGPVDDSRLVTRPPYEHLAR